MFQDAAVFLFNNLLLRTPVSVVVTELFVPPTPINHFLATVCSRAKQSKLSGGKCQSFIAGAACSSELLRILSHVICVQD